MRLKAASISAILPRHGGRFHARPAVRWLFGAPSQLRRARVRYGCFMSPTGEQAFVLVPNYAALRQSKVLELRCSERACDLVSDANGAHARAGKRPLTNCKHVSGARNLPRTRSGLQARPHATPHANVAGRTRGWTVDARRRSRCSGVAHASERVPFFSGCRRSIRAPVGGRCPTLAEVGPRPGRGPSQSVAPDRPCGC